MSRSRRILNMLQKDINLHEFRDPLSITPSITAKENVNAVAIVEDHGTCSPLPPGAEEISLELSGIWENMSHDDDECNESSRSIQEVEYNELTPFSLEMPPSFECSPVIEIEELVSDSPSTPCNKELSIPTPIPSPVNAHSTCNDEFCSQHNCYFSAVSPSIVETPRTTKKRQRNQKEWSDVKRKCLKNLGQKYVTKSGKVMTEKILGPICKCRYKCADKISHQQRIDCFTKFWKLGDRAKQWNFIIKYSDKMKKKRCLNKDTPNNRKYTYKYYLPLTSDSNVSMQSHCEKIKVCQTMFINTLAVTTRILKTAWKKYDGSTIIEEDQRGRHDNHKTILTDSMIQSVCDHVRAFTPVESHYIRKSSKKLYLLYYKRKLSCFNFTVFDMGKKKAVCYMWDETVAKRGANEVSSCLLNFIQHNVEEGVKELRFWSDNCAGENRNRIVYSLYVFAAKKFNISITHRFLQKGHTQNEGDSVHSVIERASQPKAIYTPDEWRLLARWAKNEGEPYAVRNVTNNDVFDFKCHVNNKVWLKNIKGAKIAWNNIKEKSM